MKLWHVFEERDGQLVLGIMQTLYERADSGDADLQQALDSYRREGREVHVLELEVWLENDPGYANGAAFSAEWVAGSGK